MGKTKTKIIDDSAPVEEKKPKKERAKSEPKESSPVILNEAKRSEESPANAGIPDKLGDSSATPASGVATPQNDKPKKAQKPGKAKPRSKKYQEVSKDLDRSKSYPVPEAIDMVKKLSYSGFNATLEAHINTIQTGIRGLVSLPFSSGKKLRILVFGPSTSLGVKSGAESAGTTILGTDDVIEEINKGKLDFDLVITTPEWMSKLAKVARILGPRGLMPNPKNGTITSGEAGLKKAVEGFQAGKTEYKTEPKAPVIHLGLGKLDQPTEELSANVKTLVQTLGKTKVKQVKLAPTMGPSVKVDLGSI